MLTEQQVRARISNCKKEIKYAKYRLSHPYLCEVNLCKADLRYQKSKLMRLRRELPMRVCDNVLGMGRCPICKGLVQYEHYCPNCGQRIRE